MVEDLDTFKRELLQEDKVAAAGRILRETLLASRRLHGAEHPDTQALAANLAGVRLRQPEGEEAGRGTKRRRASDGKEPPDRA